MSEIKIGQNSNDQVEENAGIGGFTGVDGKPVEQRADAFVATAEFSPFTGEFVGGFVGNQENDQPEINQYVGGFVSNESAAVSDVPAETSKTLPIKRSFWTRFKAFLFQEIDLTQEVVVELSPKEHKVLTEVHDFLFQELSFKGFMDIRKIGNDK